MGIQHSTATDAELAAKRAAFVSKHGLKDFKLSGRSLMRMVRRTCVDAALVDVIRKRFTRHYGCDLQMESRSWDHLEMLGKDGHLVSLVSHPYSVSAEGREDMAIFRRAGLVVIEGGEAASWYGYGTTQLIVAPGVLRPSRPPLTPAASSRAVARPTPRHDGDRLRAPPSPGRPPAPGAGPRARRRAGRRHPSGALRGPQRRGALPRLRVA
jgi:hypothetical protein